MERENLMTGVSADKNMFKLTQINQINFHFHKKQYNRSTESTYLYL